MSLPLLGAGPTSGAVAEFDPSTISGLVGWWKASSLALADGAAVSSWTDSSGAGHTQTQATVGSRPVYKTAIVNGRPVVRFDGVDDYLVSAFTLPQPVHLFAVCRNRSDANGYGILDGATTPNGNMNLRQTSATAMGIYDGSDFLEVTTTPLSFHVYSARHDGASSELRVDGGAATTGNPGGEAPGGVTLGAYAAANFGAPCDIAEVLVYNVALSGANRGAVETYLVGRYGI